MHTMKYYSAIQIMKFCHLQQHNQNMGRRKLSNSRECWDFQWLSLHFPMQGMQVQSLAGALRSHSLGAKKTKQNTEAIL